MTSGIVARNPPGGDLTKRYLLLPALLLLAASATSIAPVRAQTSSPPSILLIVTDDQRWDTLWAMPTVKAELVDKGVTFTNAFVLNPLCCPSRTTILTGLASGHTGVWRNRPPFGGFDSFDDSSTIATRLHDMGYRTGLFGKYLNGYEDTTYVPPGWDRWFAAYGNRAYYDYTVVDDGIAVSYGSAPEDYATYVEAGKAEDFIRSTDPAAPVFVYYTPPAPHEPAIPAPGDETAFSNLDPWRPPSYNEIDVSDKPAYVQARRPISALRQAAWDEFRRNQYRTLRSVDRTVGGLLTALSETGRLGNTLIVFTSDNGLLWGEHRILGKSVPYEESIRIPLVVRFDSVRSAPALSRRMALNVDLAPTISEVAGLPDTPTDGMSLVPLLLNPTAPFRRDLVIEHMATNRRERATPSYCGVRSHGSVYVVYATAEEELYVFPDDRYQLYNVASDPKYASILAAMRIRVQELCDPPPPDFTFPPWRG